MRGRLGDSVAPLRIVEVERLGGEGAEAAGLRRLGTLAVLVIIGNRLQPPLDRRRDAAVAHHDVVVPQMVEQRRELFLEQRQPMLHPREPAPVAHRLVERIAGRGRAERLAIVRTEPLDRVVVEQSLGRGEQREAVDPPGGTLVLGREGAHALDLVAEEIEPQCLFLAAWEQIDDAAAHRILAVIVDGVGTDVAVRLKQRAKLVAIDPRARFQRCDELTDTERRQHALRRGVRGG